MNKTRLEAFSDGVLAIIITIMVLELKVPHGIEFTDFTALLPVFLSYLLSFIYIGIYWNNHHHLFHAVQRINGSIMWANLHLLFWLSLTPFVTAWAGENHFAAVPVALYGVVLMMCGVAYYLLVLSIIREHGKRSPIALAVGGDFKGVTSVILYLVAVILTYWTPAIACAIYVVVAIIWLIPDRRMEKVIGQG